MQFHTTTFLFIFLPLVLILYYLPIFNNNETNKQTYRNIILLVFSIGFYWWGEPLFVFVLLVSVLINYYCAQKIEIGNRKTWMIISVCFNVALLFVFKYLAFISNNLAKLFNNNHLIIELALPIGISFYTFQILSYIFDVYYGKVKAEKNILHVALYALFFHNLLLDQSLDII